MSSTSSIPEDVAVWGDELLEKGDPLGEIIARPEDAALRRAYEHRYFKVGRPKCIWKHGVIDELSVDTNWGHDVMDEITRCPALRFLHTLVFRLEQHTDFRTTDPTPLLVERGLPLSLRQLTFWPREVDADFSEVYPRIPNIERLSLWEPARLGTMNLPRLTSLSVLRFRPERYAELERASLPELERLEIYMCPWFALTGLKLLHAPKLATLSVGRPPWEPSNQGTNAELASYAEREWDVLFDTPIASRVQRLELKGPLGDERETALLPRISKLDRFADVSMAEPRSEELAAALDGLLGDRLLWT